MTYIGWLDAYIIHRKFRGHRQDNSAPLLTEATGGTDSYRVANGKPNITASKLIGQGLFIGYLCPPTQSSPFHGIVFRP